MIRLTNLQELAKARGLGPADLTKLVGKRTNSFYSDLLRGEKSFGERLARSLEESLQLPRGWLDIPHHDYEIPEPTPPQRVSEASPSVQLSSNCVTKVERAPVVEWARLGEDLLKANREWPQSELAPFLTTRNVGDKCKLLRITDNKLAPRIQIGDIVAIDPENLSPKRDKVALFKTHDGVYLLRYYRPMVGVGFEAVDANGIALDSERHGLRVIGTHVCTIPAED